MTLICLKQNPQCRKRVGLLVFLFWVIKDEMAWHSLHKGLTTNPTKNSQEIHMRSSSPMLTHWGLALPVPFFYFDTFQRLRNLGNNTGTDDTV